MQVPDYNRSWFACYTRSRHEKRVVELLGTRGFDSYLPVVLRESQWADRRKMVEWPLFPGYVFARFAPQEVYRVLEIPGVSAIVRFGSELVRVSEDDLESVRIYSQAVVNGHMGLVAAEPVPYISTGDRVKVIEGPFAGMTGIVLQERGRRRLLLGVAAICQGFEVNIGRSDVQLMEEVAC